MSMRIFGKKEKRKYSHFVKDGIISPRTSNLSGDDTSAGDSAQDWLVRIEGAITSLKIIKDASEGSDLLSPLKAICSGLLTLLERAKTIKRNQLAWTDVGMRAKHHLDTFERQLAQFDEGESEEVESPLFVPIRLYCGELYDILTAVSDEERVGSITSKNEKVKIRTLFKKTMTAELDVESINAFAIRLDDAMNEVTLALSLFTAFKSQEVNNTLSHIDVKLESLLQRDTVSPHGVQHRRCLPGTRVAVIDEVHTWRQSKETGYRIYCLGDNAGVGKSTLANELATQWNENRLAVVRFFFSKGNAATSTASDLCLHVARVLWLEYPELKENLGDVINHLHTIATFSVAEQWDRLVVTPLSTLKQEGIVVIDALDECQTSTREYLLSCLIDTFGKDSTKLPNFKLFITTRLEEDIKAALEEDCGIKFGDMRSGGHVYMEDISKFIHERVAKINRRGVQLTSEHEGQLIRRSEGLFIFAATACASLEKSLDRLGHLDAILAPSARSSLDTLYLEVLNRALQDERATTLSNVRLVLGAIIIAPVPISVHQLVVLLPEANQTTPVEQIVSRLASVLRVSSQDGTVYFLHPTFREFLLDRKRSQHYAVSSRTLHARLGAGCLRLLLQNLRQGIARDWDVDPQQRSDILNGIAYAASFWIFHSMEFLHLQHVLDDMRHLFEEKLLEWIEVAITVSNIPWILKALTELHSAIERNLKMKRTSLRQVDLQRCQEIHSFIIRNQSVLVHSTEEIHRSCLAFVADSGFICEQYQKPKAATLPRVVLDTAPPSGSYKRLRMHKGRVSNILFGHDGTRLVSCANDGNIYVWDISTGGLLGTMTKKAPMVAVDK
ncbi:SubName: Full=Uncharacterized protein {ECO:0000313/EMBL:CCA75730.1} [Serendipita indica DSM 11827]|nr:SubName: Full=Uncharacterized protein {ECO:0000313/EMBL:CCA75730.1} [Serendipita indica DSM 11827]